MFSKIAWLSLRRGNCFVCSLISSRCISSSDIFPQILRRFCILAVVFLSFGVCTGGGSDNRSCKGRKTPFAVPLNGSSGSLLESLSSPNCFMISSVSSCIQFVQTVTSPWSMFSGLGNRVGNIKNLMSLFLQCVSSC